ncbi:CINP protein, partial [Polypterus senegalus]
MGYARQSPTRHNPPPTSTGPGPPTPLMANEEHCKKYILRLIVIADEVSSKLVDRYRQELSLKKTISEEIAHTSDQDLMMTYLSAWLYQPYVEEDTKLLLESMLLETGHRTL